MSISSSRRAARIGTQVGPHELWAGSPATFKKMVDPSQAAEINVKIARNYLMYSLWYGTPDIDPTVE